MIYVLLLLATLAFFEAFVRLDALAPLRVVVRAGPEGFRTISSAVMTDDEKELAVRQLSGQLLRATAEMVLKVALATAAAALVIWIGARLLALPWDAVEERLLSVPVILALVVVTLGYARVRHVIF